MFNFLRIFFKKTQPQNAFTANRSVVGIGNVGEKYKGTRHNIGFEIVDKLSEKMLSFKEQKDCQSRLMQGQLSDEINIVLVKPETFVNLSGEAVSKVLNKFKISAKNCLVVVDDFNIPLGKLRFRESGSAGGHNGLKSIISAIGEDFPRLRVGVGPLSKGEKIIDFVLGRFTDEQMDQKNRVVTIAAEATEYFFSNGIKSAMNRYNGQ